MLKRSKLGQILGPFLSIRIECVVQYKLRDVMFYSELVVFIELCFSESNEIVVLKSRNLVQFYLVGLRQHNAS